tara:strand:- start:273 stop:509 length:237 start_codon:yes stop_codon:yes gene_type:complete
MIKVGDIFERRKGHGWKRKVIGTYTYDGIDWVYYVENRGYGYGDRFACTVHAITRWGKKQNPPTITFMYRVGNKKEST